MTFSELILTVAALGEPNLGSLEKALSCEFKQAQDHRYYTVHTGDCADDMTVEFRVPKPEATFKDLLIAKPKPNGYNAQTVIDVLGMEPQAMGFVGEHIFFYTFFKDGKKLGFGFETHHADPPWPELKTVTVEWLSE